MRATHAPPPRARACVTTGARSASCGHSGSLPIRQSRLSAILWAPRPSAHGGRRAPSPRVVRRRRLDKPARTISMLNVNPASCLATRHRRQPGSVNICCLASDDSSRSSSYPSPCVCTLYSCTCTFNLSKSERKMDEMPRGAGRSALVRHSAARQGKRGEPRAARDVNLRRGERWALGWAGKWVVDVCSLADCLGNPNVCLAGRRRRRRRAKGRGQEPAQGVHRPRDGVVRWLAGGSTAEGEDRRRVRAPTALSRAWLVRIFRGLWH